MTAPNAITLTARLGDPGQTAADLERPGVLLTGHFRLLSGLHSGHFIAFSEIANNDAALERIGETLAPAVAAWQPDGVVSPSTAGVSLGSTVAVRLGIPLHLSTVDEDGRPAGLIGDHDVSGGRLLLINDVVTTGEGLVALADTARAAGAEIAGAAWFVSRAEVDVEAMLGTPVAYLAAIPLDSYPAAECPLCADGSQPELAIDLN